MCISRRSGAKIPLGRDDFTNTLEGTVDGRVSTSNISTDTRSLVTTVPVQPTTAPLAKTALPSQRSFPSVHVHSSSALPSRLTGPPSETPTVQARREALWAFREEAPDIPLQAGTASPCGICTIQAACLTPLSRRPTCGARFSNGTNVARVARRMVHTTSIAPGACACAPSTGRGHLAAPQVERERAGAGPRWKGMSTACWDASTRVW
ncbi:hypothetical protein PSPO01_09124 [Paraphaeosphaeria sporulosa]